MDMLLPPMIEGMLTRLIRVPMTVSNVDRQMFGPGPGVSDAVVTTSRCILILAGSLHYRIEGNDFLLAAGTQFLVPAWVRRSWSVPAGGSCELFWCEFDDDPREIGRGSCLSRPLNVAALRYERNAYREMFARWNSQENSSAAMKPVFRLNLEAEVKAMLARFLSDPLLDTTSFLTSSHAPHPEVKNALRWLEAHYTESELIARLEAESGLSPNYLRQLFQLAMGCSPNEYVKHLRLRQARYLLHATDWQLKRIALEVGYADPLYFSKLYRSFWGHAPSEERA